MWRRSFRLLGRVVLQRSSLRMCALACRQPSSASDTADSAAAAAASAAEPTAPQRLSDGARILPAGTATVQLTEEVDHIILGSPGLWCAFRPATTANYTVRLFSRGGQLSASTVLPGSTVVSCALALAQRRGRRTFAHKPHKSVMQA